MRSRHVVGGKAQSVKNLMDLMPPEVLVEVMKAEALYGRDGSPYHEVMFATKKIYAGSHFRAANCKKWTQRMVVTPMSVVCMFKRMNSHWAKTPPMMRRKFSKLDAEELALKCAVVTNLVKEVQAIAMISDEELNQQWVDKYISQDPQIELAVESACCSKDPNYTPRDTEILNALINKHQQGSGTMVAPIEESAVVASASQPQALREREKSDASTAHRQRKSATQDPRNDKLMSVRTIANHHITPANICIFVWL